MFKERSRDTSLRRGLRTPTPAITLKRTWMGGSTAERRPSSGAFRRFIREPHAPALGRPGGSHHQGTASEWDTGPDVDAPPWAADSSGAAGSGGVRRALKKGGHPLPTALVPRDDDARISSEYSSGRRTSRRLNHAATARLTPLCTASCSPGCPSILADVDGWARTNYDPAAHTPESSRTEPLTFPGSGAGTPARAADPPQEGTPRCEILSR